MSIKQILTRILQRLNLIESGLPTYGDYTEVQLPYTTTQDGFLKLYIDPANSNAAYYSITGTPDEGVLRINTISGMADYEVYPVKRGQTFDLTTTGNVTTRKIYFRPLCDGWVPSSSDLPSANGEAF